VSLLKERIMHMEADYQGRESELLGVIEEKE